MFYTNGSSITKTFRGVTFGPGETKEVFGVINDPAFVQVSIRKEPPKREASTIFEPEASLQPSRRGRRKAVEATPAEPVSSSTEVENSSGSTKSDIVDNKEV